MERPRKPHFTQQSAQKYRGPRQHNPNVISSIYAVCSRRLNKMSNMQLSVLSIFGGAFMCAATLASLLLVTDLTGFAAQTLLSSLGITIGLLLVILTKSALFSEVNIYVPANFYNLDVTRGMLRLFRFWAISWVGNFIGALLFAALLYLSQDYSAEFRQTLIKATTGKLLHLNGGLRGTGELILSGMLANWFLGFSLLFACVSRNLINQFIIIFLALVLINVANFQYFPINLGYFSLNAALANKELNLFNVIFFNLIPVSLGNVLGATILVAGPLLFFSKKR